MICRNADRTSYDKEIFGGPGTIRFTEIVDAAGLSGMGRLFNVGTLKPGCAVGYHTHKGEQEIYLILEGQGMYNDNGVEVAVGPGDVTLCRDGEGHGLVNNGAEDLKMVALISFVRDA